MNLSATFFFNDVDIQLILEPKNSFGKYYRVYVFFWDTL